MRSKSVLKKILDTVICVIIWAMKILGKRRKTVWFGLASLVLVFAGAGLPQTPPPLVPAASRSTLATSNLLKAECVSCHGPQLVSGGIRLDKPLTAAQLQKVLQALDYTHTIKMPPKGKLRTEQIATLHSGLVAVAESSKLQTDHWAYKVPVRPVVPKIKNGKWVKNPIEVRKRRACTRAGGG
jgi:mono/diheme cytochrome c family protein